jgi:hypothetical protein
MVRLLREFRREIPTRYWRICGARMRDCDAIMTRGGALSANRAIERQI